ncbi:uncharacterized protein LOC110038684 [Phalaenopsis equestris]|uniref:uncharacterized protein LOC110038684 n=1 Tax=Phalaenopsis equestris TaxID=78828 RepID=UPI0009E32EF9|nr:uncharacterized protein LOC110038684 [Phalaenopsis equestris]
MNGNNNERVHIDSNLFADSKQFTANLLLNDITDEEEIKIALNNIDSSKFACSDGASTIVFIPKTSIKDSWNHYRTLSLNNVIRKIIVHRLQPILPQLVSNNQAAFVKGRSIGDNILLAQELLQDLDKPCRGGNAIFKLDLKKAYDMVNWDFIIECLEARGFSRECCQIIKRWLEDNTN